MKAALALLATAPLLLAQADNRAEPPSLDNPGYGEPARQWDRAEDAEPSAETCRDTIRHVREENGQPPQRREAASPDEPLLIAAIDHRIDGCGVMVMRHDTSDVRPIPETPEGPAKLIPAR